VTSDRVGVRRTGPTLADGAARRRPPCPAPICVHHLRLLR
jgi:hypothetical protein